MAMVRGSYPVVYRPSRRRLPPSRVGAEGQLVQGVHLTDAERCALARHLPARAPARRSHERIGGCDVQPSAGKMT